MELANLNLVFAGNATVTFENVSKGTHVTYKVSNVPDSEGKFFVSILSGNDNETNYSYVGLVNQGTGSFYPSKKLNPETKSVKAFDYIYTRILKTGQLSTDVRVYHSGQCCRCGRKLTTPESVKNGLGPECIKK
jgi:hypothetical protein